MVWNRKARACKGQNNTAPDNRQYGTQEVWYIKFKYIFKKKNIVFTALAIDA